MGASFTKLLRAGMRSLCVYCGSNPGTRPEYSAAAAALGTLLAREGITLVFGGGKVGLMGVVADAALAADGRIIGVIPELLMRKEVAHPGLDDLRVVGSMHERKLAMAELADGFVALPGGIGTAEELFEAFTWLQLGIHLKPCAILDVAGYFEGLLLQLDRMVEDRFLRPAQRAQLLVDTDPARLVARMRTLQPRVIDKWMDPEAVAP
jgi:uncharacterized protein (TIGR00730 family)